MFSAPHLTLAVLLLLLLSYGGISQVVETERPRSDSGNVNRIRERGVQMLDEIKQVIKRNYFDKSFRGIDIDKEFKAAADKVKTHTTHAQVFKTIANLLLAFNDSHTKFYPPPRSYKLEYGFTMQVIGEDVFVTDVKRGSDAEAKGLRVGDVILRLGVHDLNRQSLKLITYYIYYLEPQDRLRILVRGSDNTEREMTVMSVLTMPTDKSKREDEERRREASKRPRYRCQPVNAELIACRLETFIIERTEIDKMLSEIKPYKKLILDLRGNRGGYVTIEEYLTGHFFERPVKVADVVSRTGTEARMAKPRKDRNFKGDLIVLIDSRSASASEMFARVMQLEKRGTVVGDTSSGAVMTSQMLPLEIGSAFIFYTLNVTVADVIMSDGSRLEHKGVIPDHPVGPSRQALIARTDPVLAYASGLLGHKISSTDASRARRGREEGR
jgi:C-terminal processing protease CtpA/Prc